ncbi:hypothetical protein E2562_013602 [Oryza meyeriana var. granulata]|uniref:Uncharacterized protein n=1 Tax=Oryza meyeriana var. granulata TaxID=110450 RepID=A0A6G1C6A1_9ORYZ|nr:hypothetical protein E2562_013602 [Oryza meyeriana var. granulata]
MRRWPPAKSAARELDAATVVNSSSHRWHPLLVVLLVEVGLREKREAEQQLQLRQLPLHRMTVQMVVEGGRS